MVLLRRFGRVRAARQHPAQCAVLVHHMVLQRAQNMQAQRHRQHPDEQPVQVCRDFGHEMGFGDEGQVLPKGPQDRGKAFLGGVMNPAGQWHQNQRPVQHPVHGFRGKCLGLVVGVQQARFGLRHRPCDPRQRDEEHGHAHGLVNRKDPSGPGNVCFGGLNRGVEHGMRQFVRDPAQRQGSQDQQGGQPVKSLGHAAVAGKGIGRGHGVLLRRIRRLIST